MHVDSLQASSPKIPLSSMSKVSTQKQAELEKRADPAKPMEIEVDNTLGHASDNINDLLQRNSNQEGWQTITHKKSHKKARKTTKKLQGSNKCLHSDSPLKERMPKRQAMVNGSKASEDESRCQGSPSPSPALSILALNYTNEEDIRRDGKWRASTTPKADTKPQVPDLKMTKEKAPPYAGTQENPRGGHREGSPIIVFTPNSEEHGVRGTSNSDEDVLELWFETTEGDITTNGRGLRRTANPPGEWPKVYLAAHPAFNITKEMLSNWKNIPEPTIWAHLY